MKKEKLAFFGGSRVVKKSMPFRKQFGKKELLAVKKVFKNSWTTKKDFGFQGKFEEELINKFIKIHGKGYCDVVNSGTNALYLAIKSLKIKSTDEVIVSPVTSPGGVMPVAYFTKKILVADSDPDSFNISVQSFKKTITKKTKLAVLTHLGGHSIDMDPIVSICKKNNIKLIEDCSQAHGTSYKGRKVGTFGDFGIWSTMYSKTISTGGTGGIVFTKKYSLYKLFRSLSDRGKPFFKKKFNFKNSEALQFASLNFNIDEVSSAIGSTVIDRLDTIIKKRNIIVNKINKKLNNLDLIVKNNLEIKNSKTSYFFHTIKIDLNKISVSKNTFVKALISEGIDINGNFKDIVSEWGWLKKHTGKKLTTINANNFRDTSINILFNENYKDKDINNIYAAFRKVYSYYAKK